MLLRVAAAFYTQHATQFSVNEDRKESELCYG